MMCAVIVATLLGPACGQTPADDSSVNPAEDTVTEESLLLAPPPPPIPMEETITEASPTPLAPRPPKIASSMPDKPARGGFDIFDALARMVRGETAASRDLSTASWR